MSRTPLYDIHKQLGARLIDFGGWEMPVQYTGIREEHHATRNGAGLFDVSHMGEIRVTGKEATEAVNFLSGNDITRVAPGQCQYSFLLTEEGTFVDDIIIMKMDETDYLICVNASNTDKDFAWMQEKNPTHALIENVSASYAQIAIQGPKAVELLSAATQLELTAIKPFRFNEIKLAGTRVWVARTGYTGEDGFEIYMPPRSATTIWSQLQNRGAVPCGLGARDSLRLEACLPLYGHEIDDTTNPFEARLNRFLRLDKQDFIGCGALKKSRDVPPKKILVGIEMLEKAIPRQGYALHHEGRPVGQVTSGTLSPTLGKPVALGYLPPSLSAIGTKIGVDIRGKTRQAVVVSTPFYRRKRT